MPIANFLPTNADYARFLPELILTLAGILIMFMEALRPEGRRTNAGVARDPGAGAGAPGGTAR